MHNSTRRPGRTRHRRTARGRARRTGALALSLVSAVALYDAATASASVTPGGMVSDNWSVSGAPSAGLTRLSFPITVNSRPDRAGYYWAQQYYFKNGQGAYIGLQPGSGSGKAVFSVFGKGTSTSDSHCHSGADGGSGTSCSISYPYSAGEEYDLQVVKSGTDTFTGYVVDDSTHARTAIGSWTVAGAGNLQSSGVGFQEYYVPVSSCGAVPHGQARLSAPTTSGAGTGRITGGSTYGTCKAEGGYALSGGGITMTGT